MEILNTVAVFGERFFFLIDILTILLLPVKFTLPRTIVMVRDSCTFEIYSNPRWNSQLSVTFASFGVQDQLIILDLCFEQRVFVFLSKKCDNN